MLEDKLGSPVAGLAYPFGYSNAKVRQMAQDLGHHYSCAVGNAIDEQRIGRAWRCPDSPFGSRRRMPVFQQIVRGDELSAGSSSRTER